MDMNSVNLTKGTPVYTDKLNSSSSGNDQKPYTPVEPTGNIGYGQQKEVKKEDLEKSIEALNKWLGSQSSNTHLKFQLHEEMKEYYVQVVNDQTNEVIREIPSKKIMDVNAKILEMVGLLVDEKR